MLSVFTVISKCPLTGPPPTIVLLSFPPSVGDHGYDNSLPSMHPFLAATGPSFRRDYQISTLQSVDIYPLMCHLLSVIPQPNNGTLTQARCLLAAETCSDVPLMIGLVVGVLLVLTMITGQSEWLQQPLICVMSMHYMPQDRALWDLTNKRTMRGGGISNQGLLDTSLVMLTKAVSVLYRMQKPEWSFVEILRSRRR